MNDLTYSFLVKRAWRMPLIRTGIQAGSAALRGGGKALQALGKALPLGKPVSRAALGLRAGIPQRRLRQMAMGIPMAMRSKPVRSFGAVGGPAQVNRVTFGQTPVSYSSNPGVAGFASGFKGKVTSRPKNQKRTFSQAPGSKVEPIKTQEEFNPAMQMMLMYGMPQGFQESQDEQQY